MCLLRPAACRFKPRLLSTEAIFKSDFTSLSWTRAAQPAPTCSHLTLFWSLFFFFFFFSISNNDFSCVWLWARRWMCHGSAFPRHLRVGARVGGGLDWSRSWAGQADRWEPTGRHPPHPDHWNMPGGPALRGVGGGKRRDTFSCWGTERRRRRGCNTHRLIAYCFLSLLHPEVALHSSFFFLNIYSNFTLLSLINNWTWSLTLNFQPCHLSPPSTSSPFTHIPLPHPMPLKLVNLSLIPSSSLPSFHVSLYPCILPLHPSTHTQTLSVSLLPPGCGSLFPQSAVLFLESMLGEENIYTVAMVRKKPRGCLHLVCPDMVP